MVTFDGDPIPQQTMIPIQTDPKLCERHGKDGLYKRRGALNSNPTNWNEDKLLKRRRGRNPNPPPKHPFGPPQVLLADPRFVLALTLQLSRYK